MRYQKIYQSFWDDEKVKKLSESAKVLFLYLMTCKHGNAIGCYVLAKEYIEIDLKWTKQRVSKPFNELLRKGFIVYDETVNIVLIRNHLKHNKIENPNQMKSALKIINELPKSSIITGLLEYIKGSRETLPEPFRNPPETLSKPETETETGSETITEAENEPFPDNKLNELAIKIILYFNKITGKNYKTDSETTLKYITARINEGATEEDLKKAIDNTFAKWSGNPKMEEYIRPITIFGKEKFEGYVNMKVKKIANDGDCGSSEDFDEMEKEWDDQEKKVELTNKTVDFEKSIPEVTDETI